VRKLVDCLKVNWFWWGLLVGSFIGLIFVSSAQAGSAHLVMPPEKTIEACQMRLSLDGRIIAEMKWNLKFDLEKAHAQFTPPSDTPKWYVETVRGWIDSAYGWEGAPVDWFNKEWNGCEDPI
jgi:hypothetical protein